MKKFLSIVLCAILLISNSACVKDKDIDDECASPKIENNQTSEHINSEVPTIENDTTLKNEQSLKDSDNSNKEKTESEQWDIDTNDFVILKPDNYSIGDLFDEAGYVSIRVDEKWGCMNKSGEIVISPQYDDALKFENGIAYAIKGGKIGYIKPDGSYLIEPKYDRAGAFVNGVTYVGTNIQYNAYSYSIIDTTGAVLLDDLDVAESTARHPDIIIFKKGEKNGAFIRNSKTVIPAEYDSISTDDEFLVFTKDGKQGCINLRGEIVVSAIYNEIWDVKGSTAFFRDENSKIGIIDTKGTVIVSAKYDEAKRLSNGMIKIREQNGKYALFGYDGATITDHIYYSVDDFSDGLCLVRGENGYGYIDETGKEVIAQMYNDAGAFSEGLAAVKTEYKWGYIDKTGKLVIKEKFASAGTFKNGYAFVSTDKNYYIDKNGEQVYPAVPVKTTSDYYGILGDKGKAVENCFYKKIFPIISDRALVFDGKKWGYINSKGESVIDCNYQWASVFSDDGYAIVKKSGIMYNIIDKNGNQIGDEFLESDLFSAFSSCEEKNCTNPVIENSKCYEHVALQTNYIYQS